MDMSRYYEDIEIMREIWNDGWESNWGFVPITQNEFRQLAKDFKDIVDPRICYILEKDGEPVAFSASLPKHQSRPEKAAKWTPLPVRGIQAADDGQTGGLH